MINVDLYDSYADLNEFLEHCSDPKRFSNDVDVEDPALIIGIRKWTWDHGEDAPSLPLPYTLAQRTAINDKYDVFIYTA